MRRLRYEKKGGFGRTLEEIKDSGVVGLGVIEVDVLIHSFVTPVNWIACV